MLQEIRIIEISFFLFFQMQMKDAPRNDLFISVADKNVYSRQ